MCDWRAALRVSPLDTRAHVPPPHVSPLCADLPRPTEANATQPSFGASATRAQPLRRPRAKRFAGVMLSRARRWSAPSRVWGPLGTDSAISRTSRHSLGIYTATMRIRRGSRITERKNQACTRVQARGATSRPSMPASRAWCEHRGKNRSRSPLKTGRCRCWLDDASHVDVYAAITCRVTRRSQRCCWERKQRLGQCKRHAPIIRAPGVGARGWIF